MRLLLTIDDAFSGAGHELICFLKNNNIGAIFFCTGRKIQKNRNLFLYESALKSGFLIGNHSFSHPNFVFLNHQKTKTEISHTQQMIKNIYAKCGVEFKYNMFRFPGGNISHHAVSYLREQKFISPQKHVPYWQWDIDMKDGKNLDIDFNKHIYNKIGVCRSSFSVILSHDCEHNVRMGFFEKIYMVAKEKGASFLTNQEIENVVKTSNEK